MVSDDKSKRRVVKTMAEYIEIKLADEVRMEPRDHVTAFLHDNEEITGWAESEREGLAASAQLFDSHVRQILSGKPPQGERDTKTVCTILAQVLGKESWQVCSGYEPADCVLIDACNRQRMYKVQVVRAWASPDLWRQLASQQRVSADLDLDEVVTAVREAIQSKSQHYSRDVKTGLVLALDATRLAGLAFEKSIKRIRDELGCWIAEQGFQSVWLVGPQPELTWRLDISTRC